MTRETETDPQPHPVDVHVGRQIRLYRKARRISQEKLAQSLGLTFQQVQKYERGANRVSASKLYEIAQALDISTRALFDGLDPKEGGDAAALADLVQQEEVLEMALTMTRIESLEQRKHLLALARALASS